MLPGVLTTRVSRSRHRRRPRNGEELLSLWMQSNFFQKRLLLFKLNTISNLLVGGKPYHLRKCGE